MPQTTSSQVRPVEAGLGHEAVAPAPGIVLLPFGRQFAACADLLTREGFKTVVPIDGVSPFSGVGPPDAALRHLATSDRVNDRSATDGLKDLAARIASAGAHFLVVDNSTALLYHREIDGRYYALVGGENTDLMDMLWNDAEAEARWLAFKISHRGFTDELRALYDLFVRACLDSFDPSKIILVRSHVARFKIADNGRLTPINHDPRDGRLLALLDEYFLEQTGCRVSESTLGYFPSATTPHSSNHRLRRMIEDDLVGLCNAQSSDAAPSARIPERSRRSRQETTAVDHVLERNVEDQPVDWNWLTDYFAAGGASFDDLLAVAWLKQRDRDEQHHKAIRRCIRAAVADPASFPLLVTKRRFDRSMNALGDWPLSPLRSGRWLRLSSSLRAWRWGSLRARGSHLARGGPRSWWRAISGWWKGAVRVSPDWLWNPEIALPCEQVVFRFLADGSIRQVKLARVGTDEANAVVEGQLPVTPLNLLDVLGSWPVYLERGRRGITEAPQVVVSHVGELVDTCTWIDWAAVLDNERLVITTANPASNRRSGPLAKTNLSFVFAPSTRIGTVSGGLGDQVAHIALFEELCRPSGFDLYLDDLRYTWWRTHNGFEASRLAPQLESKRITKLVSAALVESFRSQVLRTRLPWVYSQSRTWYDFGLREATVITFDHANSRRLLEIGPEFPVLVYDDRADLAGLMLKPPTPVCFYTTQQLLPMQADSAVALRHVFDLRHLEANGLPPKVARTAELLRSMPHAAFHVRRGDYLHPHFDTGSWHARQDHYVRAIDYLVATKLGAPIYNVAVFSDDLDFVVAHQADYGLDRVKGQVTFVSGNRHFDSIFDSYLMALCPVIVGSVGNFAARTSLLADPPSVFLRAKPRTVLLEWRR